MGGAHPDPGRRHGHHDPAPQAGRRPTIGANASPTGPLRSRATTDLLALTQPQIIRGIHEQYLQAGADIIETNTFNGTRVSMSDYGMEELAWEINFEATQLARQVADEYSTPDKPRFVAAVLGPTSRTLSISPDVNDPGYRAISFDELAAQYYESTDALVQGGADILLIETIFDTLNAKAAVFAIEKYFADKGLRLPLMISGTITDCLGADPVRAGHRGLLQQPAACAADTPSASTVPWGRISYVSTWRRCRGSRNAFVNAHPNAGLPNEFGEYDLDPEQMAAEVSEWARSGFLNIIGGLLRLHTGSHRGDCQRSSKAWRRANAPTSSRPAACRASNRSTSPRTRCS